MNCGRQLAAENIAAGYDNRTIIENLSAVIPAHKISVIIGANGCGKSTLLKTFARLIRPAAGQVILMDRPMKELSSKKIATQLGLLPQSPVVPEGIRVTDLVSRGRYPYQKPLRGMTQEDFAAVSEAMDMMGITALADRCVDELSGGQRQRVWIAMALAQRTDVLLLDEPTTFLDISCQVEILDLLTDLNRKRQTTVVMVMHDINLSARYADYLYAMKDGRLIAEGTPETVITPELIEQVFGLDCIVVQDPIAGTPYVVPKGRYHSGLSEEALPSQVL